MNKPARDPHLWLIPLLAAMAVLLALLPRAGKPRVRDGSPEIVRPDGPEQGVWREFPPISARASPLPGPRAREILAQAFSALDFTRGVGIRLGADSHAPLRMCVKDVGGVRCSRLDSGGGSSAVSILRNADGYWFIANGEAIQAGFLDQRLSATLDGIAREIASDSNTYEDSYRIGNLTGPDGSAIKGIVQDYSPERQALAVSAVGKLNLPTGSNGLADAIQQEIPTQTVYYLDAATNALIAQFQLNSAGKQVGAGVTYDPPGSAVDDATFLVPPGIPVVIAHNSDDLARLLRQGATAGRP